MSYLEHHSKHLRLTILRILTEAPGNRANSSILRDAAAELGMVASRDQIRGEMVWLAEQQLVHDHELAAELHVATLTERGADVAAGVAAHPGVQKPAPRG